MATKKKKEAVETPAEKNPEKVVRIKKAKIIDDLFLEAEYTEELPGHSKNETKLKCTVPIHDDLKHAFQKLHRHLALLCDEVKRPKPNEFETAEWPDFSIKGFSISGSDESEGVTISGSKEGKYGTVNLNTPFAKYLGSEYPYTSELSIDIMTCIYEVDEYLFNGKRAPEVQIEMEFPEVAEGEQAETGND